MGIIDRLVERAEAAESLLDVADARFLLDQHHLLTRADRAEKALYDQGADALRGKLAQLLVVYGPEQKDLPYADDLTMMDKAQRESFERRIGRAVRHNIRPDYDGKPPRYTSAPLEPRIQREVELYVLLDVPAPQRDGQAVVHVDGLVDGEVPYYRMHLVVSGRDHPTEKRDERIDQYARVTTLVTPALIGVQGDQVYLMFPRLPDGRKKRIPLGPVAGIK